MEETAMHYYSQALVAPLWSDLKHFHFLGSHTCLIMPGLFGGRELLSTMWINALSIISRFQSVWNKEMETFCMKGVIHLLMVRWDLGNVCFLTLLSDEKVKEMSVGRLQFELILWFALATPAPNPPVSQLSGSPWPSQKVTVHSVVLTHFSALGGYRMIVFGVQRFQNSPDPERLNFDVNTT